jgi:cytochrome c553
MVDNLTHSIDPWSWFIWFVVIIKIQKEKNMQKLLISAIAACGLLVAVNANAGDAAAGKEKSQACVGCHGMNGKSSNPMYPSLKGQQKMYLIKALKAYRDGKREDPMMSSFAKSLSDGDIEDLAAYYSGLK